LIIALTIPRAFLLGALCGAAIMWLTFYWVGETAQETDDESAATALCATSTSSPELVPDCVRAAMATIKFHRRMNQAK
jgi:hypothetical protein